MKRTVAVNGFAAELNRRSRRCKCFVIDNGNRFRRDRACQLAAGNGEFPAAHLVGIGAVLHGYACVDARCACRKVYDNHAFRSALDVELAAFRGYGFVLALEHVAEPVDFGNRLILPERVAGPSHQLVVCNRLRPV